MYILMCLLVCLLNLIRFGRLVHDDGQIQGNSFIDNVRQTSMLMFKYILMKKQSECFQRDSRQREGVQSFFTEESVHLQIKLVEPID